MDLKEFKAQIEAKERARRAESVRRQMAVAKASGWTVGEVLDTFHAERVETVDPCMADTAEGA